MVGELKNTAYRPKIAVLGAKWQYCVHPQVGALSRDKVDQACEELRDSAGGCKFEKNAKTLMRRVQERPQLHVRILAPSHEFVCDRCV